MALLAGAAEAVITPPVGTPLDGYGGRVGGATGVHDDLHVRAIVVDDGTTQAAIAGCDLIGVDRRLVADARERASAATAIPAQNIMVAATHTHAGPAGLRRDLDEALTDVTARTIAGAIIAAHARKRAAVLKAGRGSVDSVSQNRRDPAGAFDPELRVLLFDSPDPRDGAIAAIMNFACHATVMFSTNMEISADYPGYAVRTVQAVIGDVPVVFLNGACGDVNPSWIEQRYDEARRVGTIVGSEAARRLQELRPLGAQHKTWNIRWDELTDKDVMSGELVEPRVRVASRNVDVPLRALEPPEAYDRKLAELNTRLGLAADAGMAHEGERARVTSGSVEERRRVMEALTRYRTERGVAARLGPSAGGRVLHPEVQAIALGAGCAVVGLPGEAFVETAQAIREAAGLRNLLIACYANHYVGYMVPAHEFARGGYEPGVALLGETAEAALRQAAIELLRETTAG
ncbi:MAG TPA: neutral/alkaline non-lysosomal ceramidase N-terminal domain-containing protein [Dehalococcoidia bacterium]|nr:neutral/alkaline non-lysosomal ceramidase N-terminal domain-containing protein [Dehalococcoidia bacterium]